MGPRLKKEQHLAQKQISNKARKERKKKKTPKMCKSGRKFDKKKLFFLPSYYSLHERRAAEHDQEGCREERHQQ